MREAKGRDCDPAGHWLRATGSGQAGRDLSDIALVTALARNQVGALAEVYRQHGAAAYGVAGRLCGPVQAEEVTRQVFLSLWRSPGDFDPGGGSLRSFLITAAHQGAVELLRADTSGLARETTTSADELEQQVLAKDASGALGSLLSGLPKAERQAIILAYFGGYNRREVATLLRLPAQTANACIRTGVARLRAILTDERQRPARDSGRPG
jgi:RNA polymerase sigma-70 factor, ECF subfamily